VSAPAVSGAAYLERKRQQTQSKTEAADRAMAAAEKMHSALVDVSVASRRLPSQDPRLSGHQGSMVLNGAYLVDVDGQGRFEETYRSLEGGHPELLLDVRGPWPPYSFAMLEQG